MSARDARTRREVVGARSSVARARSSGSEEVSWRRVVSSWREDEAWSYD